MFRSFGLLIIYGIFFVHDFTVFAENRVCGYNDNAYICCWGYKIDKEGECTIPICSNSCGRNGECIRPDTCRCSNGVVATICMEEDPINNLPQQMSENECINNCNNNGVCVNGKCQCKADYVGESCSEQIEGECFLNLSRGVCIKHPTGLRLTKELCCGAFQIAWGDPCQRCESSRCEKGLIEIDGICQDINECLWSGICKSGNCINIHGSFKCLCSSSYRFDPVLADCVQMKKKCEQIPNLCGPGMECVSLSIHNHYCRCLPDYKFSADRKSCTKPSLAKYDMCRSYGKFVCQFGKCLPDGYNYKCVCNPGYTASSDGKSCKKSIDYCIKYGSVLCLNGKCVSLANDYLCQCDPGYTPSYDRKKCTSICDLYPTSLCLNGQCIPQPNNAYECRCNPGYASIGKGKQCRRIMSDQSELSSLSSTDEIRSSSNNEIDFCSFAYYSEKCNGGRCINMKNQYRCECLSEFVLDKHGQACKKRSEYKPNQMNDAASSFNLKSQCDKFGSFLCKNGRCVESGSSYECKCNFGFQESSDGKLCYDIDECTTNRMICDKGTCINSPGSYQCSCYDGFTIHNMPGGPKCYDRNECSEDKFLCKNGVCINTYGSFKCQCNYGYMASNNKQDCISIQETSDYSAVDDNSKYCSKCSHLCTYVNSTFKCSCPYGVESVLDTGFCAPNSQIVDVQFDIPDNIRARVKRDISYTQNKIVFELVSSANSEDFRSRVTAKFNDIILDKCEINSSGDKPGVVCFYHKIS